MKIVGCDLHTRYQFSHVSNPGPTDQVTILSEMGPTRLIIQKRISQADKSTTAVDPA